MAKKRSSGGSRNRSAISGRYVSEGYAKKHPKTTVKEKGKKK
jgi:hypothetical protein